MSTVFSPTPLPYAASMGKALDSMRSPLSQYPQYPTPFSPGSVPSAFPSASVAGKATTLQGPASANGEDNHDLADVFSSYYSCGDKKAQAQAQAAQAQAQMGLNNFQYLCWWQTYWQAVNLQRQQSQHGQYALPPFAYPPPSMSQNPSPYLSCPIPINRAGKPASPRSPALTDLERTDKTSPTTSHDSEHSDLGKSTIMNSMKKRRSGLGSSLDGNVAKKSKRKPSQEKVCCNCGTTNTPFWRKDKHGAGALCNACGLYFSKNEAPRPKMLWK
eukprot:scaffold1385_cov403-Prasinococcus_capsulatus_cf.AAC.9